MEVSAKQRVEDELYELRQRIKAIMDFLYSEKVNNVSVTMKSLMHEQLRAMQEYARILTDRLAIWGL